MKKLAKIALLAAGMMTSISAQADILGAKVGVDYWNMHNNSASVHQGGATAHPDFDTKFRPGFYAEVEHPIPLIPNVMVRYQDLDTSGDDEGYRVQSDLKMYDGILYYQLFDNPLFGIDYGLNVKYFDGKAYSGGRSRSYSQVIPTIYLAGNVNLPLTGLQLFGNTSNMRFNGNHVSDSQVGLSYDLLPMVLTSMEVRAGYRYLDMKFDDSGVKLDTESQGWFMGVGLDF